MRGALPGPFEYHPQGVVAAQNVADMCAASDQSAMQLQIPTSPRPHSSQQQLHPQFSPYHPTQQHFMPPPPPMAHPPAFTPPAQTTPPQQQQQFVHPQSVMQYQQQQHYAVHHQQQQYLQVFS